MELGIALAAISTNGLPVSNRADPLTIIVARRIIDAVKTGEREPGRLCALAIKDLSASKSPARRTAWRPEGFQSG